MHCKCTSPPVILYVQWFPGPCNYLVSVFCAFEAEMKMGEILEAIPDFHSTGKGTMKRKELPDGVTKKQSHQAQPPIPPAVVKGLYFPFPKNCYSPSRMFLNFYKNKTGGITLRGNFL